MGKKIATCSYCGTRAILILDRARHELTCRACGAPLHDMKFMPQPVEKKQKGGPKSPSAPGAKPAYQERRDFGSGSQSGWLMRDKKASKKKKKRKPLFRKVLEEIWDEVEDIFD